LGEKLGLAVWTTDQAGPFQTKPYPGHSWQAAGQPNRQAHEYIRNGTAKLLTLFHPADGQVRVKGVTSCPNEVLHPWLKQELADILAGLPQLEPVLPPEQNRACWHKWFEGLSKRPELPTDLPPLRMLLVIDNLAGHKSSDLVQWFFRHGIIPLYTPLAGSWLNMAESIQRILERRALEGQHPTTPEEIITWLQAAAQNWNRQPTPFVWGGKRAARRVRQRQRQQALQALAGSGACVRRPVKSPKTILEKWRSTHQTTH
jgi:DDE superfamily endonuclease